MAEAIKYSVNIKIDPYWVEIFGKNGTKLIMAKVFAGSNKDVFNIVASTNRVTELMNAAWEDKYRIGGTTQNFEAGQIFTGTTQMLDIDFKQTYILDSWTQYHTEADATLPPTTFGFKNQIPASAAVELYIGGKYVPVFISPTPYAPGKATLQPLPKVVFWFQSHLETATMISDSVSNPFFLNLSGGTSAAISYDKDVKGLLMAALWSGYWTMRYTGSDGLVIYANDGEKWVSNNRIQHPCKLLYGTTNWHACLK